jgi:SpoVK/Ycf46/Vps4 family AAA+-type ATPase
VIVACGSVIFILFFNLTAFFFPLFSSLEISIARLRKLEDNSLKPSQNLKNIAKDEYERNFVSAVVAPGEIGVKFEDIGALEDVKKALNELVILPMRRPELFARGNLLRPCKGILLFGPPGTGKTLLAKALATEAGANFISITGSTLTSKVTGLCCMTVFCVSLLYVSICMHVLINQEE